MRDRLSSALRSHSVAGRPRDSCWACEAACYRAAGACGRGVVVNTPLPERLERYTMVPMRKISVIALAMGAMALTACAHGGGSAQAYQSPGFHPFGGGRPRPGPV